MRLQHDFMTRVVQALAEEETDIFTLSLYSLDSDDMNYFQPEDREVVKRIFKILIQDTQKHADLLRLIAELGSS